MKRHYYPETDSLYIELAKSGGVESGEVVEGVNVDIGADSAVVGIDIDGGSTKLDRDVGNHGLPLGRLKAA